MIKLLRTIEKLVIRNILLIVTSLLLLSIINPELFVTVFGVRANLLILFVICFCFAIVTLTSWLRKALLIRLGKVGVSAILIILVFTVSLVKNFSSYPGVSEFVSEGLVFLLVTASFVLLGVTILQIHSRYLRWSKRNPLVFESQLKIILVLFSIFPIVAIAQAQGVTFMDEWFIAGLLKTENNIRGVFSISTDLGVISAACSFLMIVCCGFFISRKRYIVAFLALAGFATNVYAGLLSGSNAFILFLSFTLIALLLQLLVRAPKLFLTLSLVIASSSFWGIKMLPTDVARQLGSYVPAIFSVNKGGAIIANDFRFRTSGESLQSRFSIWREIPVNLEGNYFLGISNGVFRHNVKSAKTNTHNVFLQSLIDGGVLGGGLMCLMVLFMLRYSASRILLFSFGIATLAILNVDYFIDHSYPWILATVLVAVSISILESMVTCSPTKINYHTHSSMYRNSVALVAILVLSSVVMSGLEKSRTTAREQVLSSPEIVYDNYILQIASNEIPEEFGQIGFVKVDNLCAFQYPEALFLTEYDSQLLSSVGRKIHNNAGQALTLVQSDKLKCDGGDSQVISQNHKWLSSPLRFAERYVTWKEHQLSIQLLISEIELWSPRLSSSNAKSLSAFLLDGKGMSAMINVQWLDAKTQSTFEEQVIVMGELHPPQMLFETLTLPENYYLKIKVISEGEPGRNRARVLFKFD